MELKVPWEDAVEMVYERKSLNIQNWQHRHSGRGWKAKIHQVEIGCRGVIGKLVLFSVK